MRESVQLPENKMSEILSIPLLQSMMEDFYHLTKLGITIMDSDGSILVASGWQEVCSRFHYPQPASRKVCDRPVYGDVPAGSYKLYKCGNNMWNMVTPIVINGAHVGYIFLGQFFFEDEEVDREFFRLQARRYGYDEKDYLAALERVPRLSRDTVDLAMSFYTKLADLLSHLITHQKHREEEILYISFHDALTGLFNRRFFETEMKRLDSQRQLPLSVIMGDINGLKLINDIFGHLEGDKVLKEAAEILRKSCRADDIVARWGGDEFVILLPKTPPEVAKKLCAKIRNYCRSSQDNALQTSIALGYASKMLPEHDMERVLKDAEDMMYQNKLEESRGFRRSIVEAVSQTLAKTSHETLRHAERLKKLCQAVGSAMGLSATILAELDMLAALHDIGVIVLKDDLLKSARPLSDAQWQEVRRHPEVGYHIAKSSPDLWPVAEFILAHHEWWDGSGYPRGLAGEEIPIQSRILAVADAYEAMTSRRPYRPALNHQQALEELIKGAGSQFDPEVVRVFAGLAFDQAAAGII